MGAAAASVGTGPVETGLRLSAILKQQPSCFDVHKISVVEKLVSQIDQLPDRFRNVETVFLSNNAITSLAGIEQFPALRVLSIANNCIASLDELEHLSACPRLQILNLEFNPVTQVPNYRAHVIHMLPSVRMLDNKEVTSIEREQALAVIKKEETVMNLMRSNEALISRLERGVMKMRLHAELRAAMYGQASVMTRPSLPAPTLLDTRKLLALWQLEDDSEQERRALTERLRRDVRRAYNVRAAQRNRNSIGGGGVVGSAADGSGAGDGSRRRPSPSEAWDLAFAEVMLQQQTRIAQLLSAIELEKQHTIEMYERVLQHDPLGIIAQLREQAEAAATARQSDRDAVIADLRSTLRGLAEELHSSDPAVAAEYERKVQRLQQQLESVTGRGPSVRAAGAGPGMTPDPSGMYAAAAQAQPPRPMAGAAAEQAAAAAAAAAAPGRAPLPPAGGSRTTPAAARGALRVEDLRTRGETPAPAPAPVAAAVVTPASAQERGRSRVPQAAEESRPASTRIPRASSVPTAPRARTEMRGRPAAAAMDDGAATAAAAAAATEHVSEPTPAPVPLPTVRPTPRSAIAPAPPPPLPPPGPPAQHPYHPPLQPQSQPTHSHSLSPPRGTGPYGARRATAPGRVAASGSGATLSTDPASLQRQIELLQRDIEQHVATEVTMQNINVQLRERLEAYQQQNMQTVEQAEAELKRLQDTIAELSTQVQAAAARSAELETQNNRLREQLQQARRDGGQLSTAEQQAMLELQRARDEAAAHEAEAARVRAELERISTQAMALQEVVERTQAEERRRIAADSAETERALIATHHADQWRQRRALRRLHRIAHMLRLRRRAAQRVQHTADQRRMYTALQAWSLAFAVERLRARVQTGRVLNAARLCVQAWRYYVSEAKLERYKEAKALSLYFVLIQRRIVRAWRQYTRRSVLAPEEEEQLTARAVRFRARILQRTMFEAWRWHVRVTRRRKNERKQIAIAHATRHRLRDAMAVWSDSWVQRVEHLRRMAVAAKHWMQRTKHRAMECWRRYLAHRRQRNAARTAALTHYRRVLLARWKRALAARKAARARAQRAVLMGDRVLLRRTLRALRALVVSHRRERQNEARADQYRQRHLRRQAFSAWRSAVHSTLKARVVEHDAHMGLLRRCLQRWRAFVAVRRRLRKGWARAVRLSSVLFRRRVVRALRAWQSIARRRNAERDLCQRLNARRSRSIARAALIRWMAALHRRVRHKLSLVQTRTSDTEGALSAERAALTAAQVENVQLLDRIHALSAESASLQAALAERGREVAELQRAVEESVLLETSARAELEQSRAAEAALRERLAQMQRVQQDSSESEMVHRVQESLEMRSLQAQLTALETQLAEKTRALEQMQSAYQDLEARMASQQRESEDKLAQAFDIAASLRSLLDERDAALAAATSEARAAAHTLGDVQLRAMADTAALARTVGERDNVISSLQRTAALATGRLVEAESELHTRATQMRALQQTLAAQDERDRVHTDAVVAAARAARDPYAAALPVPATDLRRLSGGASGSAGSAVGGISGGSGSGGGGGTTAGSAAIGAGESAAAATAAGASAAAATGPTGAATVPPVTTGDVGTGGAAGRTPPPDSARSVTYAEELERQLEAAALSRTAIHLRGVELAVRDSEFEQRRGALDNAFRRPIATLLSGAGAASVSVPPATATRSVTPIGAQTAASASSVAGLQSEIDMLRQRILDRLKTPARGSTPDFSVPAHLGGLVTPQQVRGR